MKAGDIEINILANYQQIEKDLKHVEQRSQDAGNRAGKSFKDEFVSKSQMQAESILGKFQGIKAAEGLARAAASFLRSDKSMPEALLESLKSVPFAGAFVDLGHAIFDAVYDNTIGATEAAARQQARLAEAAYAEEEQIREKSAQEQADTAKRLVDLRGQLAEQQAKREIGLLRDREKHNNDISKTQDREIEEARRKNEEERIKALAGVQSQEERKVIKELYEAKLRAAEDAIVEEAFNRRREIGKQLFEEKQQAEKNAKAIAEAKAKEEQEIADKLAEEAVKRLGEFRDKQEEIEQKRADALTAGVTSANTALGTFTFDAYSDADKKRNDQDSLRQLREINQAISNLGLN